MIRTAIISDLGRIVTGNTPPRNQPELYGDYTPFIKATDISENEKHTYLPEEGYSESGHKKYIRSLIPKGSTCVVTIGSIGKKMTMAHCDCFINQAMNAIIPNEHFDNEYVYYAVKNVIGNLKALDSGTASGRENVSKSAFSKMEVTITDDIISQRKIGSILAAYDDLIENNQKQIKLLEEAAQRLYKEWFVDLRFPGHEHTKIVDGVPEGWKPCTLDDVIEFDPKVRLDKDRVKQFVPMSALSTSSMVLDINEIIETKSNSGSKFQNGDTLLARITPCLENGKTAFVYGLESDEGAVGSTEYIVMRSKRLNPYMVYLLSRTSVFRQAAINSMSGSDGRQRVKADKLKALAYLLAPTGLIHSFERIASPMFEMIFELNKQIFATTEARDRLLPKLMSGEVEV